MMGRQDDRQQTLFYDFCLEDHVPEDHLLRRIARVLDLSDVRQQLAPYYSAMGRPSLDPELMIRMLLIGYLYGIRSERRLGRRGASQSGLPLVLRARPQGRGARTVELFQDAAWPVPRQRCVPPGVRERAANLPSRRTGRRRDFRHGRERDRGRCARDAAHGRCEDRRTTGTIPATSRARCGNISTAGQGRRSRAARRKAKPAKGSVADRSERGADQQRQEQDRLRLRHQLSDRHQGRDHRRCGTLARALDGGSGGNPHHDRPHGEPLRPHARSNWRRTRPMAPAAIWPG